jgi:hypothetical protein
MENLTTESKRIFKLFGKMKIVSNYDGFLIETKYKRIYDIYWKICLNIKVSVCNIYVGKNLVALFTGNLYNVLMELGKFFEESDQSSKVLDFINLNNDYMNRYRMKVKAEVDEKEGRFY